jgi:hypothetical protein
MARDQRSTWVRRLKEVLTDHFGDIPDASVAERSIIRRAAVLEVELEQLEAKFAAQGEASVHALHTYQRCANTLRRLLESVGLQRRSKDVTPTVAEYVAQNYPRREASS